MKQIFKFKKGGIHIKEKNKGSFTRWCGGNVTEECIRKGKNSSNPKIRKKATFADNARHFKHRLGGNIVKASGGWIANIGDFLSSDKGKNMISGLTNFIGNVSRANAYNSYVDEQNTAKELEAKVQQRQNWMALYNQALQNGTDRSSAVNSFNAYNTASQQVVNPTVSKLPKIDLGQIILSELPEVLQPLQKQAAT